MGRNHHEESRSFSVILAKRVSVVVSGGLTARQTPAQDDDNQLVDSSTKDQIDATGDFSQFSGRETCDEPKLRPLSISVR